jgi:hypothetical protein
MRPIGFSTGALALGDTAGALAMLQGSRTTAVELSALRLHELAPLLALLPTLDLSAFDYVSIHAPSRYDAAEEKRVVAALAAIVPFGWPIVVHPDTIHDFGGWRGLGALVAIENMDQRKPIGRTARELEGIFKQLPEARFCFDIGHARQIDRTMGEAHFLVQELGPRLAQLHVSEVDPMSRHDPLSADAVTAFRKVAPWVPEDVPLILETPSAPGDFAEQASLAAAALSRAVT